MKAIMTKKGLVGLGVVVVYLWVMFGATYATQITSDGLAGKGTVVRDTNVPCPGDGDDSGLE